MKANHFYPAQNVNINGLIFGKNNLFFAFVLTLLAGIFPAAAQNGVKIAAASGTAHASAMLDVESTTKGMLVPRMTGAQRGAIAGPATGLIVFQTDAPVGYWYYNGSGWAIIGGGVPGGANTNVQFNNSGTFGGDASFVWDNTNKRLGIGASPSVKFHVAGGGQILGTNGTSSGTRTLTILNDGQAQTNWGSYPGAWTSALQVQNNDNTRFMWMSPLDNGSGANARLLAYNSGLDFYVGNNTYGLSVNSDGSIKGNSSGGAVRINTGTGYVDIGAMNAGWAHFQSDRNSFYFNPKVTVDGNVEPYTDNSRSLGTSGLRWNNGFFTNLTLNGATITSWPVGGADNLGNHAATTTLNLQGNNISRVNDIVCDQNYGAGLVGVYTSDRYQNVFSMGASYRLATNGSTPGNLYGLAWTHTNVGGQSKSGLSHQLLVMENGSTKVALGTGIWTVGDLTFSYSNPYISAPSYFVAPGGAYFNSGTVYFVAATQMRGGIQNDDGSYGGDVQIHDNLRVSGSIYCLNGYCPSNYAIRLTSNLHLNSGAGNAVIANWDNGTSGATQTFRTTGDGFYVYADGQTFTNNWFRPLGTSGLYFQSYGGGWFMQDATYIRGYNNKTIYNSRSGYPAALWDGDRACQGYWGTETYSCNSSYYANYNSGYVYATTYGYLSTRKSKKNIEKFTEDDYKSSLAFVDKLDLNYYIRNDDDFGTTRVGFIAEETPGNLTVTGKEGVLYGELGIYNTGAIRVLKKRVENLEQQLSKLSDFGTNTISGSDMLVPFSSGFTAVLGSSLPVVVLSPSNPNVKMKVSNITKDGFTVKVVDGTPSTSFSWIAMAEAEKSGDNSKPAYSSKFEKMLESAEYDVANRPLPITVGGKGKIAPNIQEGEPNEAERNKVRTPAMLEVDRLIKESEAKITKTSMQESAPTLEKFPVVAPIKEGAPAPEGQPAGSSKGNEK